MTIQVKVLETVVRRAPLGLRFLDLGRQSPVTDGLTVLAWQRGADGPRFQALRSPLSGVYGYRSLPELGDYENGLLPALTWCSSPPTGSPPNGDSANFVVTVDDRLGRFLPQLMLFCLPKERLVTVPLFSSPARLAPEGMGAIRGELWDRAADRPAAWASVTASINGSDPYTTVADGRGMFTLLFPYAASLPALLGSPPHGSVPLDQLTWPVTLQVLCQPRIHRYVPGVVPPDTRSILDQAAAVLYEVDNRLDPSQSVSGPSLTTEIQFGVERVVKTTVIGAETSNARLLLDPAP